MKFQWLLILSVIYSSTVKLVSEPCSHLSACGRTYSEAALYDSDGCMASHKPSIAFFSRYPFHVHYQDKTTLANTGGNGTSITTWVEGLRHSRINYESTTRSWQLRCTHKSSARLALKIRRRKGASLTHRRVIDMYCRRLARPG
ncbi:hypothetical protein F4782DRAFT_160919 [Xylaria castorea]|nr:hypothetical protein F4782DRAFT_160919 [Xylaria castorea]